jgi:hypothetical protein
MKWFYVILIAAAVAAITIAVQRVTHTSRSVVTEAIIALSLAVILVALLKFLSKMRE